MSWLPFQFERVLSILKLNIPKQDIRFINLHQGVALVCYMTPFQDYP